MAAVAQSRTSLGSSVATRSALLDRRELWTAVLLPFAASRVVFVFLTLSATWWIALLHIPDAAPVNHDGLIPERWMRWDAVWYLRVAQQGYRLAPYANGHVSLAFFPLFPAAVHLLLTVWPWPPTLAAMAISNACALGASLTLYRLIAMDMGPAIARRASWVLVFFPTSLYFFAGYSEGAFMLVEVLCFYCLRRQYWWRAGLTGALATATRPTGLIMLVPAAIFWCTAHRRSIVALRQFPVAAWPLRRSLLRGFTSLGAVAMLPAGLAAFMIYLWVRFGDPLLFIGSQRSWHRTWAWPWRTALEAVERPFIGFPNLSADQLHGLLDLAFCLILLTLSLVGARRLPPAYRGYLWAFWLMVFCTPALLDGAPDPLISVPRFVLTTFPITVLLAQTPLRTRISLVVSVPLLAIFTLIFISGGWVA